MRICHYYYFKDYILIFNKDTVKRIAKKHCINKDEESLIDSFVEVCLFLSEFPHEISWKTSQQYPNKPSVNNEEGLDLIAKKYFEGYRRSDFPAEPNTVPDEMVSVIMETAYGYTSNECKKIKIEHQYSMCAENCVGNLLERYLDSKLRKSHWNWCCGEFVKAIDFLGKNSDGEWIALQIKNRNNSENSSSSAIRDGSKIQKWFRSFSKNTKKGRPSLTNWENLPPLMSKYDLNEKDFQTFVRKYIKANKPV